jgi:hypothetical protein
MGTSGAYGGSSSQAWKDVRELWTDFEPNSSPAPAPGHEPAPPTPPTPPDGLDSLGAALAQALLGARIPTMAANCISLSSILPGRGGDGPGGGGRTGGGSSRSAGGSGARRDMLRHAARGGAAIGAASAYRDRDQAALAEYGISLEQLDAMTPRQRCAAILDLVLGEAGHPDEQAIRSAAIEEVKKIMNSQAPQQSALESVRDFIGALAVQIGLVELGKRILAGTTSRQDAARKERDLKQWVASKIRALDLLQYGTVHSTRCHQVAYDMARNALRLMAAR